MEGLHKKVGEIEAGSGEGTFPATYPTFTQMLLEVLLRVFLKTHFLLSPFFVLVHACEWMRYFRGAAV